ncbi:MAG: glycosyltransferase family 2 protein [Candidatus Neomarinimicrobiota bacterium]
MISLSVITVTYNSQNEIRDFLDSAIPEISSLQGTLIIIDNNSKDDTVELIQSYSDNSAVLSLIINKKNVGFSRANNQGINQAKGEYLLFLNPDIIVPKDSINKLLKSIRSRKTLGAVAPQLRYPTGNIQRSCRRFPQRRDVLYEIIGLSRLFKYSTRFGHWKMADFSFNENRNVDQPAGAALMIKRDLINRLNGFDTSFPMFFSDVDLCRRIWNDGYQILFDASVSMIHLGGASIRRVPFRMIVSSHRSFYTYFRKNYLGRSNQILNVLTGFVLLLALIPRIIIVQPLLRILPFSSGRENL